MKNRENKKETDRNLKTNEKSSGMPDYMWLASLGINLVVSSLVGLFIGFYLDKWLNTKPILMFVFFFIGLIAGFRQIIKEMKKIEKNSQ